MIKAWAGDVNGGQKQRDYDPLDDVELPVIDGADARRALLTALLNPQWIQYLPPDAADLLGDTTSAWSLQHLIEIATPGMTMAAAVAGLIERIKEAGQDYEEFQAEFDAGRRAGSYEPTHFSLIELFDKLRDLKTRREGMAGALKALAAFRDKDKPASRGIELLGVAQGRAERVTRPVKTTGLVRMSDVPRRQVDWLWRFPIGKLALMCGDPGEGKSTAMLDIMARETRGGGWPDSPKERWAPGNVVILSCEDDLEDTMGPRLDQAGADSSRVFALPGVMQERDEKGKRRPCTFSLTDDLPRLEQAILEAGQCRLAVVDPIGAFLGKTDSNSNNEVRAALTPLADLAARLKVAIVAIAHLNKGSGMKALHRLSGSTAFVGAARVVWFVGEDKEQPGRRLMLPVKNNLAPKGDGLSFVIRDSAVAWDAAPVRQTADEALGDHKAGGQEREEAIDWLRTALADGPLESSEIKKMGDQAGHSWATIRRAKEALGIKPHKEGFGAGARWMWAGPTKALTEIEVEQAHSREHLRAPSADVSIFDGQDEGAHPYEDAHQDLEGAHP